MEKAAPTSCAFVAFGAQGSGKSYVPLRKYRYSYRR